MDLSSILQQAKSGLVVFLTVDQILVVSAQRLKQLWEAQRGATGSDVVDMRGVEVAFSVSWDVDSEKSCAEAELLQASLADHYGVRASRKPWSEAYVQI